MINLVSYLVAVAGTGLSAYFDLKTTYIPDEITHTMIALGIVFLFLRFSVLQALYYLGIGIAVFLVGFLVYTFGQLGGGDVKLYTGISLLVPDISPMIKTILPPYPPIVSIFLASALLGVFFISIDQIRRITKIWSKIKRRRLKLTIGLLLVGLTLFLGFLFSWISLGILVISVPIATGLFIYPFKDDLLENYIIVKKDISDITEDDIIAIERVPDDVKAKLGIGIRKTYLEPELKKIREKAKKLGIREVYVYENLPTFGIYIFLGLILVLLFGDPLFTLLYLL